MKDVGSVWAPSAVVGGWLAVSAGLAAVATAWILPAALEDAGSVPAFAFVAAIAGWQASLALCHLRRARPVWLAVPAVLAFAAGAILAATLLDAASFRLHDVPYGLGTASPFLLCGLAHVLSARGRNGTWLSFVALASVLPALYLGFTLFAGLAMPHDG